MFSSTDSWSTTTPSNFLLKPVSSLLSMPISTVLKDLAPYLVQKFCPPLTMSIRVLSVHVTFLKKWWSEKIKWSSSLVVTRMRLVLSFLEALVSIFSMKLKDLSMMQSAYLLPLARTTRHFLVVETQKWECPLLSMTSLRVCQVNKQLLVKLSQEP